MFRLLLLGAIAAGGFFAYKRIKQRPTDDWDDDTMYGSAALHQVADAPTTSTGTV